MLDRRGDWGTPPPNCFEIQKLLLNDFLEDEFLSEKINVTSKDCMEWFSLPMNQAIGKNSLIAIFWVIR